LGQEEGKVELRYRGFQQERGRRLYNFDCPGEVHTVLHFVVSVDMALFLKHRVGIQEGPALCAQKLTADLAAQHQGDHELTNEDLVQYTANRAAADARKAEARKAGPHRKKVEPGQQVSPWWR
jgi:hypothetical protein